MDSVVTQAWMQARVQAQGLIVAQAIGRVKGDAH